MVDSKIYDVIIIGGSYAGLSAAMSLGRALRNVLVIDNEKRCNAQTPHAHNFITHDGKMPSEIITEAINQIGQYNTVVFLNDLAISGSKNAQGFTIKTQSGKEFISSKLLLATGLKDIFPDIKGFADCWGISILHCPYCHGYEVKNMPTGIFANGEMGFEYAKLISNWTKDLTVLTNGKSTLTQEQTQKLADKNVKIIEKEIFYFEHESGKITSVVFKDKTEMSVSAIYSRPLTIQHSDIYQQLGCELTEQGLLKIDMFQKTNIEGVFACGDNSSMARALSVAIASGSMAGAFINKEIIDEEF